MKLDKTVRWHPDDASSLNIKGMQVTIIGGTGGIGRALSRHLASLGAQVTVVGQTFRDQGTANISFIKADLSLMQEAKRVASALPVEQSGMLIFTTGIFAAPQRQQTAEGIERDLAVSYLSRLVILRAIAHRLTPQRSNPLITPRVFLMGYPGSGQIGNPDDLNAEKSYKAMSAHMNTVAGNEMLVLDGARRLPGVRFYGLNPGLIKTSIRNNFFGEKTLKSRLVETLIGWFTPSAQAYAERITPLLFSPEIDSHSGAMFNSKGQAIQPSQGLNSAYIRTFLTSSEALIVRADTEVAGR